MRLSEYLTKHGAKAALARALSVTPVLITQWSSGVRQVPAERCPDIEDATAGEVTCEELRPDVRWKTLRKPTKKKKAA